MMIDQGGIAKFTPYGSLSLNELYTLGGTTRKTQEMNGWVRLLDVPPVTVEVFETWNSPVFRQTDKTIWETDWAVSKLIDSIADTGLVVLRSIFLFFGTLE